MLLKSSLFLIFLGNIYFSRPVYMGAMTFILILINLCINKNIKECLKKMRILFFFYLGTCMVQIFYFQEGEILYTFYKFHVTKEGATLVLVNFLRISNLIMMSWLVNSKDLFKGKLRNYQKVSEQVIEMVPEVFNLFKRRMKLKWFFRYILTKIRDKT